MGEKRRFAKHIFWTSIEEQDLRDAYARKDYSRDRLQQLFPNRAVSTVESKAYELGLRKDKKTPRSKEEILRGKREYQARKRKENPDACREYARCMYQANRSNRLQAMKDYQAKRFFWQKSRKLKPAVAPETLAALWKAQRGVCALTGVKLDRTAQLDHIVPRARGGSDDSSNLRWVSCVANALKRDLLDSELVDIAKRIIKHLNGEI